MARPVRIQYPGVVCDMVVRGNQGREVFRANQVRQRHNFSSSSAPHGAVLEAVPGAHLINTDASARCMYAARRPSPESFRGWQRPGWLFTPG
jgi:hypothetical protein